MDRDTKHSNTNGKARCDLHRQLKCRGMIAENKLNAMPILSFDIVLCEQDNAFAKDFGKYVRHGAS